MTYSKQQIFSGLDLDTAIDGIIKGTKNSQALMSEAKQFYKLGKLQLALAFSVISIEEIVKTRFLYVAACFLSNSNRSNKLQTGKLKKLYRSHRDKHVRIAIELANYIGIETSQKNIKMLVDSLEYWRQDAFYVDYRNKKFYSPQDSFRSYGLNKSEVKLFIKFASEYIKDIRDKGTSKKAILQFVEEFHKTKLNLDDLLDAIDNKDFNSLVQRVVKTS